MSFGAYISNVYTLIGLIGLAATCGFAWWKGDRSERLGALMLAVAWIGADLARGVSNQLIPIITLFVSDALLALGFLYIAIRYSSLWLGAMMILQACAFALHATQMADSSAPRWHGWILYLLLNNVINYSLLLTLAGGTIAAIARRGRQRREKASAEAKAAGRSAAVRAPPPQTEAAP